MLLQAFDYTENVFRPFAAYGAFFLLLLGGIWIINALYEWKSRGSFSKKEMEEWDRKITTFLKVLTYFSFVVGVVCIISGVAELILKEPLAVYGQPDTFTAILLIVAGVATFLKPINDIPIASIVGLIAASAVVILVAVFIPPDVVELLGQYVDPKWLMIIIFIIVFAIVVTLAKLAIEIFIAISKVLSWPPIAVIFAGFCFVQVFFLLVLRATLIPIGQPLTPWESFLQSIEEFFQSVFNF
ncbi:MAG: conserved membrane protein of unknown function [Promethearchaeota archaeon]|nr:MAG: conserved membrane protein of unknown function [Candidatus Lokiarchaeota archaeon]